MQIQQGTLYVVATPIGNLGDLSHRATTVLQQVNLIACEDTRTTQRLLKHIGHPKPLHSYHEHNERAQTPLLCQKLQAGHSIALVSDAGTPLINDPGFRLITQCNTLGIPISPIPGPSAITTLLSVSALPTHTFLFLGYAPPKKSKRNTLLQQHAHNPHTLILLESTHRIEALLTDITHTMGKDRWICMGRELTKLHETILTAPCQTLLHQLQQSSKKGEFTLAIAPASFQPPPHPASNPH